MTAGLRKVAITAHEECPSTAHEECPRKSQHKEFARGFTQLSSDGGIIYGIHDDGRLLFFQDEMQDGKNAPNGSTGWSATTGNQIGQGWA